MLDLSDSRYRVIDLSFLVVPGANPDRPFEMQRGYLADGTYKMDVTCTHTHVGTHVEAEAHFFEGGRTIEQYPPEAFYGRGLLLQVDQGPGEGCITAEYLEEQLGERLGAGDIIVARNASLAPADLQHFTEAAAEYLRKHRMKMLVLGDNLDLGRTVPEARRFHELLLREATIMEIVANLEQISQPEFLLLGLPIRVAGADSGWCRALVVEER